jgi:hypothetical protein
MVILASIRFANEPDQLVTALFADAGPKDEDRGDHAPTHLAGDTGVSAKLVIDDRGCRSISATGRALRKGGEGRHSVLSFGQ